MEFKKGDRVKVALEGEVVDTVTNSFKISVNKGVGFWLSKDDVAAIRIQPPLPTAEGSVIKTPNYGHLVLSGGVWGSFLYDFNHTEHELVDFEVIFDAGANR